MGLDEARDESSPGQVAGDHQDIDTRLPVGLHVHPHAGRSLTSAAACSHDLGVGLRAASLWVALALVSFGRAVAEGLPPRVTAASSFVLVVDSGPNDEIGPLLAPIAGGRRVIALDTQEGAKPETLVSRVEHAGRAYRDLHIHEALDELDAVERLAMSTGAAGLSPGALVDLYVYRAACRETLGLEGAAWDDWLAAAALAPERRLDPARFAPRLLERHRRAQAANAQVKNRLEVTLRPAGGTLFVDGQVQAAYALDLPVGRHFVRGELAGHVPAGRVVDITSSKPGELILELSPRPPPAPAVLRARAAQEGVRWLVVARRAPDYGLELSLVDGASGQSLARRSVPRAALDETTVTFEAQALLAAIPVPAAPPRLAPAATPLRRRWWVWVVSAVAVGAVAAAIAVPTAILNRGEAAVVPELDLARYR